MKVTSAVAVASTVITAAACYSFALSTSNLRPSNQNQRGEAQQKREERPWKRLLASPEDSFVPRFDGLRFIETLVTGHR